MSSYYMVADHIHLCAVSNGVVVLDLNRDKYHCIRGNGAALFHEFIQGEGVICSAEVTSDQKVLIGALSERNWVVQKSEPCSRSFELVQAINSEIDINSVQSKLSLLDIGRALLAMTSAHIDLKYRAIKNNVNYFKNLKSRYKANTDLSGSNTDELLRIRQLVMAFEFARPLYPRKKICLFDSYAMLKFLTSYSIYPDWVFAILELPFTAHCWIQYKGEVLNDSLDVVRPYQPIMVI